MNNASGAGGRERRGDAGADPLFPSDGHFSRVVPLSEAGDEAAPLSKAGEEAAPSAAAVAPDEVSVEPEEREEATLVLGVVAAAG